MFRQILMVLLVLFTACHTTMGADVLPLGMTFHDETTNGENAAYSFEADGGGMLTIAIRAGADVTFEVRATNGQVLAAFDSDLNGNGGNEQGAIVIPAEGEYTVTVRPLGDAAEFIMGASWLPFEELGGELGPGLVVIDPTEDAELIVAGERFEDKIDAGEGETMRWYCFEAEADGTFVLMTRAPQGDLVIEAYNDGVFGNYFAYSDGDSGSGSNEAIMVDTVEGEKYYIKVRNYSENGDATFSIMTTFFEEEDE